MARGLLQALRAQPLYFVSRKRPLLDQSGPGKIPSSSMYRSASPNHSRFHRFEYLLSLVHEDLTGTDPSAFKGPIGRFLRGGDWELEQESHVARRLPQEV